jgi:ribosomal protein S12 methylthiotransferase accessory factor
MENDTTNREVIDMRQRMEPFASLALKRRSDVIDEIARPCSRFRSILTGEQRRDIALSRLAERFDFSARDAFLFTNGVPLNWQLLLDYLNENGVTDSKQFQFSPFATDAPKVHSVYLEPHADASDTDGSSADRHGFGSTDSIEESMSRAIGELLERYCLTVYRRADLYTASYSETKKRHKAALDIFKLNDFLPWQKEKYPRFVRTEDRPVAWVEGTELLSGTRTLIPAQLVYWNYAYQPGEMVLAQPTTNGGAGHFSRNEAVLAGLLEAIQRDGFLIYWLNGLSPKRIDPSTIIDAEVIDFLRYLRRYRLEYHFLNTTTDIGVPSCACVLVDASGGEPVIAVGGSAGFSFKELIMQSAREALAVYAQTSTMHASTLPAGYEPFTDLRMSRRERLALWMGAEMYGRFKFFINGPLQSFEGFMGEMAWQSTPDMRLSYVLVRFRELGPGYEAYAYEVEHPVLQKLGYHAVKTVVPRLMHLYLRESMATLAAPRLKDVPAKLGYAPAQTLTPWPHPFP